MSLVERDTSPSMMQRVTFAIPGDLETLTGGYIYEKQVLLGLRRQGWTVDHLALPDGFPEPTPADVDQVTDALAALTEDRPVLLDGFLTGAMPPDALRSLRAPYVSITHHPLAYETGLPAARARYLKQVEGENLARAAHVIVPSHHTAKMLVDDFAVDASRLTVALPGILRPAPRKAQVSATPEILVVGQLVPRKGHDVLLNALSQLVDLDWQTAIVGHAHDADHARHLRDLTDSLELRERVEFTGQLTPEALAKRYANASVFALATRYEGYGMVFAEAMAHGLPIVTCAGGAVPETVPAETAVIVPPDNADAFASALRRVLCDDDFRTDLSGHSEQQGRLLPTWDDTARIIGNVLSQAGH